MFDVYCSLCFPLSLTGFLSPYPLLICALLGRIKIVLEVTIVNDKSYHLLSTPSPLDCIILGIFVISIGLHQNMEWEGQPIPSYKGGNWANTKLLTTSLTKVLELECQFKFSKLQICECLFSTLLLGTMKTWLSWSKPMWLFGHLGEN